ncbi:hypothetical protein C4D60_Mb10t12780 [Musa balbisiana]|uniref:Uncharacterized protein n=1 Tax=Musa balbisiana TaxID=52838 RepID=A0A4S8IZ47_MUSBA|nr:hypothetical protein C4D60_Mb10t12780 [Musa balbisiana]
MCRLILCLLTSEAKIKANELTCSKHEGWIYFHLHSLTLLSSSFLRLILLRCGYQIEQLTPSIEYQSHRYYVLRS